MSLPKKSRWIFLLLARFAFAAIFLLSAYAKIKPVASPAWSINSVKISLTMFAFQVDAYQLLSHSAAIQVARLLPPFELLLGLWLLTGIGLRFSSLCTSFLLGGFLFALVWAYAHGLNIDCGCGNHEQVGPKKIVEDVLMLALAVGMTLAAFKAHASGKTPKTDTELSLYEPYR